MSLFLWIGCFIIAIFAISGIAVFIFLAQQGQGVSDARQGWIEGTGYEDDE